jgi:N-acetylmuramoyl-L-alanine amidase
MTPEPVTERREVIVPPTLPEVPAVDGPLDIKVVYPTAGGTVDAGDSTFAFGSVGSGRATLTVNGTPVRVWPNGTWLAWVKLPADPESRFDIVAKRGRDSVRSTLPVRRTARFRPPARGLWVDTTSFAPMGRVWWPGGEPLPVSVRASDGASLRLRLPDGRAIPLGATPSQTGVSDAVRAFDRDSSNVRTVDRRDLYTGALVGVSIGAPLGPITNGSGSASSGDATLEVARNGDTLRVRWPIQVTSLSEPYSWIETDDDRPRKGNTDRITYGRALPGGTYHWFFPNGTRAPASARVGDDVRIRLAGGKSAWVALEDVRPIPNAALGSATVGSITATSAMDRVSLRIPVGWRVPFEVEEHEDGVTVLLYSAVGDVNWIRHGETRGMLRDIRWRQRESDVVAVTATLTRSLWGYRTRWEGNDLVVEVRPQPDILPSRPLQGLTIVVDPGHPPVGSRGPSGLTEAEANLGVALVLERLLSEEGARVLLTRKDGKPVDLWPRVRFADSVDAHLLISIHNNALPDGVNPFSNNGSSVFYFHPRGIPLARAIQAELGRRLPLRDLGIARGDLALVRGTWMPSVLVEGMFMLIPEQEAALRTDAGRYAYADAVRAGIRAFLDTRNVR